MPNEFQYDYGANWNNTFKMGTMALADNAAKSNCISNWWSTWWIASLEQVARFIK